MINITLRLLQKFKLASDVMARWSFGEQSGMVIIDAEGIVTVPGVVIRDTERLLTLIFE